MMGLFQTASASSRIISGNYGSVEIIFLIVAILMVALAISMFPKFRFSPRVEIDSEEVKIKPDFFNRTSRLKWNSIETVKFGSYQLSFLLKDGSTETFILPGIKEISLDVKKAIREICEDREIEIVRA